MWDLYFAGVTMSIVSASVQMCKAIRDLVYDVNNSRHRERVRLCVDSIDKASSKLRDFLLSHEFKQNSSAPSVTQVQTSEALTQSALPLGSVTDVHKAQCN